MHNHMHDNNATGGTVHFHLQQSSHNKSHVQHSVSAVPNHNAEKPNQVHVPAGMYLGELARRIILRLAEIASLFGPAVPELLHVKGTLQTSFVCNIHHDTSADLQTTACALQEALHLPADQVTREACQAVSELINCQMCIRSCSSILLTHRLYTYWCACPSVRYALLCSTVDNSCKSGCVACGIMGTKPTKRKRQASNSDLSLEM